MDSETFMDSEQKIASLIQESTLCLIILGSRCAAENKTHSAATASVDEKCTKSTGAYSARQEDIQEGTVESILNLWCQLYWNDDNLVKEINNSFDTLLTDPSSKSGLVFCPEEVAVFERHQGRTETDDNAFVHSPFALLDKASNEVTSRQTRGPGAHFLMSGSGQAIAHSAYQTLWNSVHHLSLLSSNSATTVVLPSKSPSPTSARHSHPYPTNSATGGVSQRSKQHHNLSVDVSLALKQRSVFSSSALTPSPLAARCLDFSFLQPQARYFLKESYDILSCPTCSDPSFWLNPKIVQQTPLFSSACPSLPTSVSLTPSSSLPSTLAPMVPALLLTKNTLYPRTDTPLVIPDSAAGSDRQKKPLTPSLTFATATTPFDNETPSPSPSSLHSPTRVPQEHTEMAENLAVSELENKTNTVVFQGRDSESTPLEVFSSLPQTPPSSLEAPSGVVPVLGTQPPLTEPAQLPPLTLNSCLKPLTLPPNTLSHNNGKKIGVSSLPSPHSHPTPTNPLPPPRLSPLTRNNFVADLPPKSTSFSSTAPPFTQDSDEAPDSCVFPKEAGAAFPLRTISRQRALVNAEPKIGEQDSIELEEEEEEEEEEEIVLAAGTTLQFRQPLTSDFPTENADVVIVEDEGHSSPRPSGNNSSVLPPTAETHRTSSNSSSSPHVFCSSASTQTLETPTTPPPLALYSYLGTEENSSQLPTLAEITASLHCEPPSPSFSASPPAGTEARGQTVSSNFLSCGAKRESSSPDSDTKSSVPLLSLPQNEWLTDGLTRVAVRGSNARPAAPRLADPLALYLNGVCPGCGVAPLSDAKDTILSLTGFKQFLAWKLAVIQTLRRHYGQSPQPSSAGIAPRVLVLAVGLDTDDCTLWTELELFLLAAQEAGVYSHFRPKSSLCVPLTSLLSRVFSTNKVAHASAEHMDVLESGGVPRFDPHTPTLVGVGCAADLPPTTLPPSCEAVYYRSGQNIRMALQRLNTALKNSQ